MEQDGRQQAGENVNQIEVLENADRPNEEARQEPNQPIQQDQYQQVPGRRFGEQVTADVRNGWIFQRNGGARRDGSIG